MKRRNINRTRYTAAHLETAKGFSWNYFVITVLAGLVFATGLFFAARQHFISVELGIKNAKLRNQLSELENEKRRLELERAVALSPGQLKKNARNMGFRERGVVLASATEPQRPPVGADRVTDAARPRVALENKRDAETAALDPSERRSRIVRTANDRDRADGTNGVRRTVITGPIQTSATAKLR